MKNDLSSVSKSPMGNLKPDFKETNPDALRSYDDLWQEILQKGHLQSLLNSFESILKKSKVINYKSAKQRLEEGYALSNKGEDLSKVVTSLNDYMTQAVNTQSPYFLNQLYGGAHPVAVLSEFVAAFMNTSMATYEIAPIASVMEHEILQSLKDLMNWSEHDGIFVPGGSYANMMAVHLARFKLNPETKLVGHDPRLCLYTSDQAHYSLRKAAHLLGFGEEAIRVIRSDENYRMSPQHLDELLTRDKAQGFKPCMVMSTLGTTVFGAFDPLKEIQEVCKRHEVWHHADGAWGGPMVFLSESLQEDLKTIDSISYDFHKLLGAGLTKAVFMTSHSSLMAQANSCLGTDYIFHQDEDSFFDTGVKAIQCGRKVDSLSLWCMWKHLGTEGFASYVQKNISLRDIAQKEISKYGYTLLHEPEYLNLCFKLPGNLEKTVVGSDELQRQVRQDLIEQGDLYVNYSSDETQGVFFRLVLNHLRLDEEVIHRTFALIDKAWQERVKKNEA